MNTQQQIELDQTEQNGKNIKPSGLCVKSDNKHVSFEPIYEGAELVKWAKIETDKETLYNISILGKPLLKVEEMPKSKACIQKWGVERILEMCARIYCIINKLEKTENNENA